jgi:redox-regulated HSP33 family molecular chaperone
MPENISEENGSVSDDALDKISEEEWESILKEGNKEAWVICPCCNYRFRA